MAALNPAAPAPSSVTGGSAEAFCGFVDPYRRELLVHCYRMLGSIDDAEDAVQDALVRAWHGRNTFQRSISFRAWLYRIATNACLDAIDRRKRGSGREDNLGVGPFPDDLLGGTSSGPEARYDARASISLAFLTVLQVLPPRQRAVLILRDVLSWRAAEVAALLDLSVPAVNSALQRARSTVARRYGQPGGSATERSRSEPGHLRSLLERYVRAWEAADVAGLVALLRDDAVLSMPPGASVTGAAAIGAFLANSVLSGAGRRRLVPTGANGGPPSSSTRAQDRANPFGPSPCCCSKAARRGSRASTRTSNPGSSLGLANLNASWLTTPPSAGRRAGPTRSTGRTARPEA